MPQNPLYRSEYTIAQIARSIGKNPIIDAGTNEWMIWDMTAGEDGNGGYVRTGIIGDVGQRLDAQDVEIAQIRAQASSPFDFARTADDLSDTTRCYVWVGPTVTVDGVTFEQGAWYYHDGAWTKGGMQVDDTLKLPGVAADAEVTGNAISDLKSAIEDVIPICYPFRYAIDGKYVSYTTGEKIESTNFSVTNFIPLGNVSKIVYKRLKVTANNPASGMAFFSEQRTSSFVGGQKSVGGASEAGYEMCEVTVPSNANYAQFTWWAESLRGERGEFELYEAGNYNDNLKTDVDNLKTDVDNLKPDVGNIKTVVVPNILPYTYGADGYALDCTTGETYSTSTFCVTDYVDLTDISTILYSRLGVAVTTTPRHGMAYYDASKNYISGIRSEIADGRSSRLFQSSVPNNAKYARFTFWNSTIRPDLGDLQVYNNEQYISSIETRTEKLEVDVAALKNDSVGITHEKPKSQGVLNVIRRCRQFTDIKWTPAFNIPRRCRMSDVTIGDNRPVFEDVFISGHEYTGIPYGRATRDATLWGYDYMKVGFAVDFEAFVSAVSNPESVVAKRSSYDPINHDACFYATVCAALCSYAYNLDTYYTAAQLPNVSGMSRLGYIGSTFDIDEIDLGHMLLNTNEHGAVVTDIIKDNNGTLTYIEVSEATTCGSANWNVQGSDVGGVCRRKTWNVEEFLSAWDGYGVYRYGYIDNVTYTKSPYVDTGNEGDEVRNINFPCIPYMGEGFVYKVGYIPNTKILTAAYKEGVLDKLRIYKDGNPWNSDGTTNLYDVNGLYISAGFESVGNYVAYMCNSDESVKTDSCHWTVID